MEHIPEETSEESLLAVKEVQDYKVAVEECQNEGENQESMAKYGDAVRKLLGIKGGVKKGALSNQVSS